MALCLCLCVVERNKGLQAQTGTKSRQNRWCVSPLFVCMQQNTAYLFKNGSSPQVWCRCETPRQNGEEHLKPISGVPSSVKEAKNAYFANPTPWLDYTGTDHCQVAAWNAPHRSEMLSNYLLLLDKWSALGVDSVARIAGIDQSLSLWPIHFCASAYVQLCYISTVAFPTASPTDFIQ